MSFGTNRNCRAKIAATCVVVLVLVVGVAMLTPAHELTNKKSNTLNPKPKRSRVDGHEKLPHPRIGTALRALRKHHCGLRTLVDCYLSGFLVRHPGLIAVRLKLQGLRRA